MLVTKSVKIKWSNSNKKWYTIKGYIYSKNGDEFEVKIEDLQTNNTGKIEYKCDYCGESVFITYSHYNQKSNKHINKDSCRECYQLKVAEIKNLIMKQGENNKDNIYYLSTKENRIKELNNYLIKYRTLTGIYKNEEGKNLYHYFIRYGDNIVEEAIKLGWDIDEIKDRIENNHYDDFETLKKQLELFIQAENRFPKKDEIKNILNIDYRHIQKHGGIQKIKEKMNYLEADDLIDDNGFINKSLLELKVAQFLINNTKIKYDREVMPFKKFDSNLNYRSDFTFYKNNNPIHVEVWGGYNEKRDGLGWYDNYKNIKSIKESLYKKYGVKYISIMPSNLAGNKKSIEKKLSNIFEEYMNESISQNYLLNKSTKLLTDEELLEEIIPYIKDNQLPSQTLLILNNKASIYNQILQRYDNYIDFARKYGYDTNRKPSDYWDKNKIYETFNYILSNYGHILSSVEIRQNKKDINLKGFLCALNRYEDGYINAKLKFLQIYTQQKLISDQEVQWLSQISRSKSKGIKITNDNKLQAKNILDSINNKGVI